MGSSRYRVRLGTKGRTLRHHSEVYLVLSLYYSAASFSKLLLSTHRPSLMSTSKPDFLPHDNPCALAGRFDQANNLQPPTSFIPLFRPSEVASILDETLQLGRNQ